MKKFTLFASMLVAGASAFAQTAAVAAPELTTNVNAPKTYAVVSYRGTAANEAVATAENLTYLAGEDYGVALTQIQTIDETALWYFTAGTEEGTFVFHNVGFDGTEMTDAVALANEPEDGTAGNWYIFHNPYCAYANGDVISRTNPISNGSCIDARRPGNAVLTGTWQPSATDWDGTTWLFIPVEGDDFEALQVECQDAFMAAHPTQRDLAEIALANAVAKAEAFMGITPWTDSYFKEIVDEIKAIEIDDDTTQQDVNDEASNILAAIDDAEVTDIVAENIVGKTFTMQSARRAGLDREATYLGQGTRIHTVVDEETGDTTYTTVASLNSYAEVASYCVWQAVKDGEAIKLQNFATKEFVAPFEASNDTIALTKAADEAVALTVGFYSQSYPGVTFYNDETDNMLAINVVSYVNWLPAVAWSANDGGSTWKIALFDVTGIEAIRAEGNDSNAPVEYYTVSGMRINPANAHNGIYIRRQGNNVQKIYVK